LKILVFNFYVHNFEVIHMVTVTVSVTVINIIIYCCDHEIVDDGK